MSDAFAFSLLRCQRMLVITFAILVVVKTLESQILVATPSNNSHTSNTCSNTKHRIVIRRVIIIVDSMKKRDHLDTTLIHIYSPSIYDHLVYLL